jgi:hypothetical protein
VSFAFQALAVERLREAIASCVDVFDQGVRPNQRVQIFEGDVREGFERQVVIGNLELVASNIDPNDTEFYPTLCDDRVVETVEIPVTVIVSDVSANPEAGGHATVRRVAFAMWSAIAEELKDNGVEGAFEVFTQVGGEDRTFTLGEEEDFSGCRVAVSGVVALTGESTDTDLLDWL